MKLQEQFCGKMKCTYKVAEKPFHVHKNASFILVWFILVLLKLQQTMEKYYSFQKKCNCSHQLLTYPKDILSDLLHLHMTSCILSNFLLCMKIYYCQMKDNSTSLYINVG